MISLFDQIVDFTVEVTICVMGFFAVLFIWMMMAMGVFFVCYQIVEYFRKRRKNNG